MTYPMEKMTGSKVVVVKENEPALIPCRPAHPKFNVTLLKMPDEKSIHDVTMSSIYWRKPRPPSTPYYYHPRLGFIFERYQVSNFV